MTKERSLFVHDLVKRMARRHCGEDPSAAGALGKWQLVHNEDGTTVVLSGQGPLRTMLLEWQPSVCPAGSGWRLWGDSCMIETMTAMTLAQYQEPEVLI